MTDASHHAATAPGRSQRAIPKVQRWTDLIASLLRHHVPVSFDEIAREVPGYAVEGKDRTSVKRTFERDKKELLRFGVPIEVRADEIGEPTLYTIARTGFYEREGRALEADGALVMDHPLADAEWGIRHVLQYGPDAVVVAPPAMRDAVRARLASMSEGA